MFGSLLRNNKFPKRTRSESDSNRKQKSLKTAALEYTRRRDRRYRPPMIYKTEHTIQRPAYIGGGTWVVKGLTDITIFMGKNGSGKSVLLREW